MQSTKENHIAEQKDFKVSIRRYMTLRKNYRKDKAYGTLPLSKETVQGGILLEKPGNKTWTQPK